MSRSLPEWIGKNADQAIPPSVRDRVFTRADERCAICTLQIKGGLRPAIDHIVALINGGENREFNLQLLCVPCHQRKTKVDVGEKSTVYRKRLKDRGIRKPRTMTTWRKFDGTIVRAEKDR